MCYVILSMSRALLTKAVTHIGKQGLGFRDNFAPEFDFAKVH